MEKTVFTVTQLNYSVRNLLEGELGQIWLTGEISNFSSPASGHWYLTLKDEQAQVRAAMFKMKNQRVGFRPQNGMQVLVRASVSLYEPRGDYQILIESMQPAGDGLLQQQFEALKMRLAAEGLFAQQHKKTLPTRVKRLGVITSPSGAALQDILQILARRDPSLEVVIYPSLVQGREAADDICAMIDLANRRHECDVLIVGRGGGSLEDLWCFNEERVARAIFHSAIPIVSAVGHEIDVTIADFVADLRAPTPSAAAELVSRDRSELARQLQHQFDKINLAFDRLWSEKITCFHQLQHRLRLKHPSRAIQQQRQQLNQIYTRLLQRNAQQRKYAAQQLEQLHHRLKNQHPSRKLAQQQQQLDRLSARLTQEMKRLVLHKQQQWRQLYLHTKHSSLLQQLERAQQSHQVFAQRLLYAMEKQQLAYNQAFQTLCTRLEGLNPLKILARGYSITHGLDGAALTSTVGLRCGELITTRLKQGSIVSQVVRLDNSELG